MKCAYLHLFVYIHLNFVWFCKKQEWLLSFFTLNAFLDLACKFVTITFNIDLLFLWNFKYFLPFPLLLLKKIFLLSFNKRSVYFFLHKFNHRINRIIFGCNWTGKHGKYTCVMKRTNRWKINTKNQKCYDNTDYFKIRPTLWNKI